MRDIQLVEQTTDYNCGAAALAMVLGLSDPGEVERDYLRRECGTSHADRGVVPEQVGVLIDEVQRVLFEAGIPSLSYVDLDRCIDAGAWVCRVWDRVRICSYDFLREHFDAGGAAMLVVPSLNKPDTQHWIVVSGDKVFDPSRLKKYQTYAEIPALGGAILVGKLRERATRAGSWLSAVGAIRGIFHPKARACEGKHSPVSPGAGVTSHHLSA
jgi:hypothetical protein